MESNRDENFSCALEEIGANTAALNILPEKSKGHDLFMKLRAEKQVCGFLEEAVFEVGNSWFLLQTWKKIFMQFVSKVISFSSCEKQGILYALVAHITISASRS